MGWKVKCWRYDSKYTLLSDLAASNGVKDILKGICLRSTSRHHNSKMNQSRESKSKVRAKFSSGYSSEHCVLYATRKAKEDYVQ